MPPRAPRRRWFLLAALGLSLGFNGYLLYRAPSATPRAAPSPRGSRVADAPQGPRGARPRSTAKPSGLGCRQQLRLCRLQSWRLVMQQAAATRRSPGAAAPTPRPAGEETGFQAQRDALCAIGLKQLRRNWEQARAEIRANVMRDLADPRKAERDVTRQLDDFDLALNLTGRQRSLLERDYRPLREARVGNALAALRSDPPDYRAALDAAAALFEDEDRLIRTRFGDTALAKARAAQLEKRTAVLAILAAMADVPWDRSIAW